MLRYATPECGTVGEPTLPDLDTSSGRVYTLVMREPSAPSGETRLVRTLGVRELAANVVNQIVGAGIFALPAAVAHPRDLPSKTFPGRDPLFFPATRATARQDSTSVTQSKRVSERVSGSRLDGLPPTRR
jgi:hypothetical protein